MSQQALIDQMNQERVRRQQLMMQVNQQAYQMQQAEAAAKAAMESNIRMLAQMPASLDISAQTQTWLSEMQAQTSSHNTRLSALNASIASMVCGSTPQLGDGPKGFPMPMTANFGAFSPPWSQPGSLFFHPFSYQGFPSPGNGGSCYGSPPAFGFSSSPYNTAGPGYFNGYMC